MTGMLIVAVGVLGLAGLFAWSLCRAAAWGDRPVDPPLPVAPKPSPLVEPLTVTYDLLVCRRGELEALADRCKELGDSMAEHVWLEKALHVQKAADEVADLRAIKAGEL